MVNYWLMAGVELVRLVIILGFGLFMFRRWIIPTINEQLEATREVLTASADKMTKTARLAGIKSNDYQAAQNLEGMIGKDIVSSQIPELALLKTFLSPSTSETIEETMENNPEQILGLYQKYGHLLGALGGKSDAESDPVMF